MDRFNSLIRRKKKGPGGGNGDQSLPASPSSSSSTGPGLPWNRSSYVEPIRSNSQNPFADPTPPNRPYSTYVAPTSSGSNPFTSAPIAPPAAQNWRDDNKSGPPPTGHPAFGEDTTEPPPEYEPNPGVQTNRDDKSPSATAGYTTPGPASAPPVSQDAIIQRIGRAGTWDHTTQQFRNINMFQSMTPAQIRKHFRGVDGVPLLREVDTILLIDSSRSMADYGLWPLVQQVLETLVPIVGVFDSDGFSLYTLDMSNHACKDNFETGQAGGGWHNLKTMSQVTEIFKLKGEPSGTTPTDTALKRILGVYMARVRQRDRGFPKALNIIAIGDGAPNDRKNVETIIYNTCVELDELGAPETQLGIQFLQIAEYEFVASYLRTKQWPSPEGLDLEEALEIAADDIEEANDWLTKLDNWLGEQAQSGKLRNIRDIVDTKSAAYLMAAGGLDPITIIIVLTGAMIRRFDGTELLRQARLEANRTGESLI